MDGAGAGITAADKNRAGVDVADLGAADLGAADLDSGSQHREEKFLSIMEPVRESCSACREDLLRTSP